MFTYSCPLHSTLTLFPCVGVRGFFPRLFVAVDGGFVHQNQCRHCAFHECVAAMRISRVFVRLHHCFCSRLCLHCFCTQTHMHFFPFASHEFFLWLLSSTSYAGTTQAIRISCAATGPALPIGAIEKVLGSAIDFVRFFAVPVVCDWMYWCCTCAGVSYNYALPCIGC